MRTPSTERQWITRYSELGTNPVPVESCVSAEYFEREREAIFRRGWLNVGRVEEVPHAGDYVVKTLATLNTSIIVIRGQDGVIRGFHNVCRHRGNQVAPRCRGSVNGFMCGFHGWTYDAEGELVHVPDEEQFYDLDRSELGLIPVATDVWEGFIFIKLDLDSEMTLPEYLTELGQQLSGFPFDTMRPVASHAAEVNVNWKIFMDIFQECYHVAFVHQRSVSDVSTGRQNPLCHLLSTRLHARHRSASVFFNPEHKPTPAEALAFKYGAMLTQGASADDGLPTAVNPERSPNWLFDINVIFPNFILDLSLGTYWTYHFWPVAVDRTLWEMRLYMNPAKNAGEKISQEFNRVLLRDALREDLSMMENIQANMSSGALKSFQLSDQEIAVRHAYHVVESVMRHGE